MPVHYVLREKGWFVHIRATGRFTSKEIKEVFVRLAADPSMKADHVTLFDTTGAESEAIDEVELGEVMKLEKQDPVKLIGKKMAILVKDRRFVRNAKSYQHLSSTIGETAKVFSSLVEATNWLSS